MHGTSSATTGYNETDINNMWQIWDTKCEKATPCKIQILMVKTHTHTLLGPISKNVVSKEAEHTFPDFWYEQSWWIPVTLQSDQYIKTLYYTTDAQM